MDVFDIIKAMGGRSEMSFDLRIAIPTVIQFEKKGIIPDKYWDKICAKIKIDPMDLYKMNQHARQGKSEANKED